MSDSELSSDEEMSVDSVTVTQIVAMDLDEEERLCYLCRTTDDVEEVFDRSDLMDGAAQQNALASARTELAKERDHTVAARQQLARSEAAQAELSEKLEALRLDAECLVIGLILLERLLLVAPTLLPPVKSPSCARPCLVKCVRGALADQLHQKHVSIPPQPPTSEVSPNPRSVRRETEEQA